MLDDKEIIIKSEEEVKQDTAIDNALAVLTLDAEQEAVLQQIIAAPTQQELQAQIDLFNLSQAKKDAIRIAKLNGLLGKVEDQAIERFTKRPDQISNKELLEFMTVVSGQIDRSQKYVDAIKEKPVISQRQVNNGDTNVQINIGTNLPDRDSNEQVIDVIQSILKQLGEAPIISQTDEDIDETIDIDMSNEKIVYNNDSVVESEDEDINKGESNE